ncbi:hypothetical protein [Flavobacterium limi]|uniref:hypothetical protein n=1 Tax=Flavobacterium limi TaxID=2045105 RepID=UPI0013D3E46A|nr:hypothetical protein [Flavobacterium limi]
MAFYYCFLPCQRTYFNNFKAPLDYSVFDTSAAAFALNVLIQPDKNKIRQIKIETALWGLVK